MKKNKFTLLMITLGLACIMAGCAKKGAEENTLETANYHNELLGDNVFIFSPKDDMDDVQKTLAQIASRQETAQFEDARYAIYFLPGEYPDLEVNVGFYTQVAGLGASPTDVKLGKLNCNARWLGGNDNHNATCNFWRSVENIEINDNVRWAVSQATDMRRVKINGNLALHDNHGWASGGFLADSLVTGVIDSGSQQQWLSRNNEYSGWTGNNWNMVFLGDDEKGAPTETWPKTSYTNVGATQYIQEKPFLIYDNEYGLCVYVPNERRNAFGISWAELEKERVVTETDGCLQDGVGKYLPIENFYVAKAGSDNSDTINVALREGKHLLFTPGIYEIDKPIIVEKENTIVLGTGLATLKSTSGNALIETTDAEGIIVAGLLLDAGSEESPNMMVVGSENIKSEEAFTSSQNGKPISLSDIYFRIGGCKTENPCKTDCALTINASNVSGDNFWIWRADHSDQVGWKLNTARNGLIVNGDNVRIVALMVEHFQEYQTIWNGNNGEIVMYQSEIPYDVPMANEWMSDESTLGYSSIYVDKSVTEFKGSGIGIYAYNRDTVAPLISAMTVPDAPGVSVTNIITVILNGNPGIKYPVNEAGNSVVNIGDTAKVYYYCNGEWH